MNIREFAIMRALAGGGSGGGGGDAWIGDGNTHIWVSLPEGATDPMIGICPDGTATVDWGDGSAPDVLTGIDTSTKLWTPVHHYASPGDYIITVSFVGRYVGRTMCFAPTSSSSDTCSFFRGYQESSDKRNYAYALAIQRVEIGHSIDVISAGMFLKCIHLRDINIAETVRYINSYALRYCYSLRNINLPSSIERLESGVFGDCWAVSSFKIPAKVSNIPSGLFQNCYSVRYYDFTEHTAVPTVGSADYTFQSISPDCQIRVPAALVDEWKAATNWSALADQIVGV